MTSPLDVFPILANFLRKMHRQRHLIFSFVRRDLRARYVGSLIGIFWSVLHPLVLLASYTFVFAGVFKVPVASAHGSFALFLFCGILPWLFFQETLIRSAGILLENSQILKKTLFPAEILPITVVCSTLVHHGIGFCVLLSALLWKGLLTWTVVLVPLYLVLLALLALGLAWIVSALQLYLRDTAQVLSVLLIFWFWFTPIFYERSMAPKWIAGWLGLNPLTYVVESYRMLLLEGRVPPWHSFWPLLLSALVAFFLGGLLFRSLKREFVDVL